MKLTESKLRAIVRSTIKEYIEPDRNTSCEEEAARIYSTGKGKKIHDIMTSIGELLSDKCKIEWTKDEDFTLNKIYWELDALAIRTKKNGNIKRGYVSEKEAFRTWNRRDRDRNKE